MEEQVCQAAPFTAKTILPTHSQLIAVIAGFALAAFILLLDKDADAGERSRGNVVGALLLGLASVIGLTGAFLFSSVSGDHCMNSILQYDTATAIMAITALLMVAGISVAAAGRRQLAETASALRVVLVIAAVIMCFRFFNDYVRSDSVSREYARFIEQVGRLNAHLPTDRQVRPGSVATLDRQLTMYAENRWPGREDEWAGLLAEQFYRSPTSSGMLAAMWLVAVAGVAWAIGVRWVMTTARRVSADGVDEAAAAIAPGSGPDPPSGASEELISEEHRIERLWRRWMAWLTMSGVAILVVLFSLTASTGMLVHPDTWQRLLLFFAVVLLFGLIAQPPLMHGQSSVIDRIGRRLRPSRHS